jgi:2-iminobutanoate/2-iminopropanoate deaminase
MRGKATIHTEAAPPAVGPYSQAIKSGGFIFTSGQIPADSDGKVVFEDIAGATKRCLENVREILRAGGAAMADVVKVTIFLKDIADYASVNEIYKTFFPSPPPARTCVQVAALPKDVPIEIEAIAQVDEMRVPPLKLE